MDLPSGNTAFRGTLAMFADLKIEHRERLAVGGPVIYFCNTCPTSIRRLWPRFFRAALYSWLSVNCSTTRSTRFSLKVGARIR